QMHDMVLDSLAAGLLERGIATLRFNFRGVGASEGVYDGGAGEEDDARAALATLSAEPAVDGQRLGLAGYSFGAGVAVGAAARASGIAALVLV
ncbi:MAG: CocE/NonD family hydrolase, partial [Candidatus Brocadiia bacterium]|nr:CocE/NonD family hydrolase [Candidatus Brocadiia bacterium]